MAGPPCESRVTSLRAEASAHAHWVVYSVAHINMLFVDECSTTHCRLKRLSDVNKRYAYYWNNITEEWNLSTTWRQIYDTTLVKIVVSLPLNYFFRIFTFNNELIARETSFIFHKFTYYYGGYALCSAHARTQLPDQKVNLHKLLYRESFRRETVVARSSVGLPDTPDFWQPWRLISACILWSRRN